MHVEVKVVLQYIQAVADSLRRWRFPNSERSSNPAALGLQSSLKSMRKWAVLVDRDQGTWRRNKAICEEQTPFTAYKLSVQLTVYISRCKETCKPASVSVLLSQYIELPLRFLRESKVVVLSARESHHAQRLLPPSYRHANLMHEVCVRVAL
jgi:hypothetical protein